MPASLTCALFHGNQNLGTDARVEVTWASGTLSPGTLYEFQIFELKNPPTPSDDRHVITVMTSEDNTGAVQNSGKFFDFTLIRPVTTPTTTTLAAGKPTYLINLYLTPITLAYKPSLTG